MIITVNVEFCLILFEVENHENIFQFMSFASDKSFKTFSVLMTSVGNFLDFRVFQAIIHISRSSLNTVILITNKKLLNPNPRVILKFQEPLEQAHLLRLSQERPFHIYYVRPPDKIISDANVYGHQIAPCDFKRVDKA